MIVAGVDGCPDGWIAAVLDTTPRSLTFQGFRTFDLLLEGLREATAIGVDIQIGLTYSGERQADKLARLQLPGKTSSVFSAPHPAIRHERDFLNAIEISQKLIGKGISRQLLGILPKIAEVGYTERLVLLDKQAGFSNLPERKVASKVVPGMKVNADDTLDAIIAAWSAERFANRQAIQIPSDPEFGFRGLAAQIAF
jgi:predicted RNase H-like nuclease